MEKNDDTCKIITDYGKIGDKKNRTGEMCEVKLATVSWYGKPETYDIRMWRPDGSSDKGISLSKGQLKRLREILDGMDL